MKKLVGWSSVGLFCVFQQLCGLAMAQTTVPFYVDSGVWNNTVIPTTFNGVTADTVPELWSLQALFNVKYVGTTTVRLIGENSKISGSGRVPSPSQAITTISGTGIVVATPTLLASVPGAAPFTVYIDALGDAWTDSMFTVPLTYDIYGNPIDPSTTTFNADGTVATAGTAYVTCPSCSNLLFTPAYTWPCVTADGTVSAVDCQRNHDPSIYYGPPITGWLRVCAEPTTPNPDGSITEQYQACTPTWTGGGTQIAHSTYDSPAYTAGAAVVDASSNPVTLTCMTLNGTSGPYQSCSWSGELPVGTYLLTGAGTADYCHLGKCRDGSTTLGYPVTLPAPPPPPAPLPPSCGTPTTPPCDD